MTCTASGGAARSTVDVLTFRAVTRTLLLGHTWQLSTKAMLLVWSEASAKSPRRAPVTVKSTLAVAQGRRLGRSQVVSNASVRGTGRQRWAAVEDRWRVLREAVEPQRLAPDLSVAADDPDLRSKTADAKDHA
jgi:hypothetical protein